MKFFVVTVAFLLCCGMSLLAGQSSNSGSQATADTAKPTVQSSGTSAVTTTEKAKTKPRKVWTNDEISNVGGDRAISVVGKAGGGDSNPSSDSFQKPRRAPGTSKPPLTASVFISSTTNWKPPTRKFRSYEILRLITSARRAE